ncbi:MAG: protein translocase subunit SecF [Clostridia bacterium]|nr:protein translocase subunit SecF [Clostridia bacterium]
MSKFKSLKKFSLDETIEKSNFNICKNLKWFIIAPITIILVGIILLLSLGFNRGIDFTGGSIMTVYTNSEGVYDEFEEYDIEKDSDYNEVKDIIRDTLKKYGLKPNVFQTTSLSSDDLGITDGNAVLVKYQNKKNASAKEIEELNEEIRLELLKAFGYIDADAESIDNQDYAQLIANGGVTTASASSELLMKAFIALIVAVVLILIYVAIRFEITSGLAAILALFTDILVTCSLMLIFRVTINSSFIAALITILGYSINNTIIIFDRIRENIKSGMYDKQSNEVIANVSVKEMMSRTIFTTITTFVVIFFVTVIGVSDIREFAFPIMIGIISGFYTSNFITPGLWAIAYKKKNKKKKVKMETQNKQSSSKYKEAEVVENDLVEDGALPDKSFENENK